MRLSIIWHSCWTRVMEMSHRTGPWSWETPLTYHQYCSDTSREWSTCHWINKEPIPLNHDNNSIRTEEIYSDIQRPIPNSVTELKMRDAPTDWCYKNSKLFPWWWLIVWTLRNNCLLQPKKFYQISCGDNSAKILENMILSKSYGKVYPLLCKIRTPKICKLCSLGLFTALAQH